MKRVLLIPSDHGGGRGHVSRCLYLADQICKNNNEAALVLEHKHFKSISSAKVKTFLLDTSMERFVKYQFERPFKPGVKLNTRIFKRPVFVEFDSLAYQVPRDGYWTAKLTDYRFEKLNKIIDKYKPDVLIGDTHFLTFLCGQKFNIPVIQITRLAGYPSQPKFLWWKNNPLEIIAPDGLAPFEHLISKFNIKGIEKAEDLLSGTKYIIPAIPEIEPINPKEKSIIFSGALAQNNHDTEKIPFFDENKGKPKIYISIGGGAGRSNEKKFFNEILTIFNKYDFHVLVSTGNRVDAKSYNNLSNNVHFENWVHGLSAIRKSDLVIYHGGYGTTLEILSNSKSAIVLPSHTEQEGNGRRLESIKLGKTILFSNERRKLEFSWPYGDYSMNAGFDFNLEADKILQSVNELLNNNNADKSKSISNKLALAQNEFNVTELLKTA